MVIIVILCLRMMESSGIPLIFDVSPKQKTCLCFVSHVIDSLNLIQEKLQTKLPCIIISFLCLCENFQAKESSYQDFLLGLKEISCLHARLGTQNSKMVFSGQGLIRANTSKKKNSTCQWMKAPGCFLPCLYDGVLINCHWFQGQLCGRPCWLNGNRKFNALRIWLACRWLCITDCVCVSIMNNFCFKSFPLCPLLY